ncbi:MAG: AAA family ATPase, partial [Rhodocyclaceae bacterium]|nr:AAA family ATPase [Rhodocyclaceae bacterium]
ILNLELVHWDFWQRATLPLDAPIVTIVGPNGSGKTTLLDALRTLLAQECSKKRDYKRYARKSGQPFTWLRGVVDNRRGSGSGGRTHPFFPLLGDQVTLACRIEKKGGDWTREYCVAEGDIAIETLASEAQWMGVREYARRLEHAGLSRAIARVLSLEQGQTDKLCEYAPRELLDLVFHVFGDKTVLDRYQEARDHQRQTTLELRELESQLQRLGAEVEKLSGQVNRYREWRRLSDERMTLFSEIMPRLNYHELQESIRMGRVHLSGKRREYAMLKQTLVELDHRLPALRTAVKSAAAELQNWDVELTRLQQTKETASRRETRCTTLLERRTRLIEAARLAGTMDADALAHDLETRKNRDDHLRLQLLPLREKLEELDDRIARLMRGERADPLEVRTLREALQAEGIIHALLPEVVELQDETWQTAVEALLQPYRHLILLADANDQSRAFALGERLRYRHFIVPERQLPPTPSAGSMLEVIRFTAPVPPWLIQLLDRTQRVADANEGSRLPRGQDWITQEGYLRERRGGRHAGTGSERHFGRAQLAALQAERADMGTRLATLDAQRQKEQTGIVSLTAALSGARTPTELADSAEEFAQAMREQKEAQTEIATTIERQNIAYAASKNAQAVRETAVRQLDREETQRAPLQKAMQEAANQPAREEQARRILRLRHDRATMPPAWKDRAANVELAKEWSDAAAVEREIKRLEIRLAQDDWITDENVIALRNLRAEDYQRQSVEHESRQTENLRATAQTDAARGAYIDVLRHTLRSYGHNLKTLGKLAEVAVEPVAPHLENDDVSLAQAGLDVRFDFDQKGFAGMNDGEASGGQQVIKSLILLIALMMDDAHPGGFVFIDEPFAHLDIINIDRVASFLKATRAQYLITTPITHNVNVYDPAMLTLVTYKKRPGEPWAPRIARLVREKNG